MLKGFVSSRLRCLFIGESEKQRRTHNVAGIVLVAASEVVVALALLEELGDVKNISIDD